MGFLGPSAPPKQRLVTQAQYDASIADFEKNYTDYTAAGGPDRDTARQQLIDSMLVAPPPAPDQGDDLVKKAQSAARRRLLQGNALVGPLDMTPVSATVPGLKGY